MNTIVQYKAPESYFQQIKESPVPDSVNQIEGILYFYIQEKASHKEVDLFLNQFQNFQIITIVTFSYQAYEMFYVRIRQRFKPDISIRVFHAHPQNLNIIARSFWQYRIIVSNNESKIQDLINYKIQTLEEIKNRTAETVFTRGARIPDIVYMLCPSFGKQCGIAEYSEEILRGQFDCPVWGVTHTTQITNDTAPVIIQHEFSLYNPETHLSTETESILIHFLNNHKGKIYIAMHTVPDASIFPKIDSKALLLMKTIQKNENISVIVFTEQMEKNLQSTIPIDNKRLILMDLGLPVLEYPDINEVPYTSKTVGIIGFNSGGKDLIIKAILEQTNYNIILIGRGYDSYLNNQRIRVVNQFLPNSEFDKMIIENVLVGISHRNSTGYSSSASYRRLLALGVPTVAANVPEHNFIRRLDKSLDALPFYLSENEMIQQIHRLMRDKDYYQHQKKILKQLRSFTTINQWKPVIEGAYA
jgi:hypothetical protein